MLRRRRSEKTPPPTESFTARWLPRLREADWVLPPSLARDDLVPSWTTLGVVDGAGTTLVDSRGLVGETSGASIDWWVGADDRWYLPAREPGVTQVRLEHAPVVETTMRIPGGEVVHRAYGVRGARHPGGDEWVVVEVENRSPLPVVLAWAVRPYSPSELWSFQSSDLEPAWGVEPGSSGPQLITDTGDPIAVMARAPSRWARGLDADDPVHAVLAGEARTGPVLATFGDDGQFPERGTADLASLALLTPLPHTATARLAWICWREDPVGLWSDDGRARVAWPGDLPQAGAVARGWSNLVSRGPRIEVPDPVLADAVEAARRSLVLAHRVERRAQADDSAVPDPTHVVVTEPSVGPAPAGEAMEVLTALARWGHHDLVDRALITWPEGQQRGGGFGSVEATTAALGAMAAVAVAGGDAGPARAWLPEVGGAIESLGRLARKPSVLSAADVARVASGLDAGAVVMALVGQPDAAAAIAADAERARTAVLGADPAVPATTSAPGTGFDGLSVTPRQVAAAAVDAPEAIWALLRRASATWTWSDPERWVGDDLLVPARLLTAVGRLLVADRADGLALTTWVPPAWWGLGWEVHDVATRWGTLAYAVRWHSGRPALLWELGDPLDGIAGDPVLTAAGLDPTWSTTERRGEALLAAVAPPAGVEVGPEVSTTGGVAVAAPPRSVWRPQDPGPDAPAVPPAPAADLPDDGASFT